MSPPTPEQERALAAAARDGVTAVAAGAGAGKTTLMVEALWRDLERDGVALDRLFVATYNRAAAAHLVERLQRRFADPDDGRGPERVGLDLSGAWVGTFHALAARIVRESPFVAGVDPEFGEIDETEAAALKEQALDEAMEACMARPGFLDLVGNAPSVTGLRDATRQVHERLRSAGHEDPRIVVPDASGPAPEDVAALEAAIAEVAAHPRARDEHHAALDAARAMLLAGEAGPEAPRLSLSCAASLKPLCEGANAIAARVFQALVDQEATEHLAGFATHLQEYSDRYARLKRDRGALDYEDLLLAARRVLRAGTAYDFARVYVDEFQDANALQAEIVDLLAADRTVLVGDGCQAIYGFRHADATHFAERVGDPPEVTLRDNHRSQAELLCALNGLLAEGLSDEPTFAALTCAAPADRPGPPLAAAPLEIVDVVAANGPATREEEAEAVADLVAALIDRGYAHREIAVLFRALTAVEPYRAAIAARGIPVHLVAGRGFFTHDQVADTMALLALVANPYDEEALIRVLASPYVSASDSDLVALRRAAGHSTSDWPATGALWPAAGALAATRPLVGAVEGLRPLLRERGLAGLVEAAIDARGYDLAVLGLPDGARRYANLRRLVRMAEGYAAVRGPDLGGFLSLLRTMADAGNQDPGEASVVDPDLDAVRLATVHGVKGQEFPAVLIADGSHGLPTTSGMVLVDADGNAAIRISRVGGKPVQALGYREALDASRSADAAEERRITYVAATRAERHLAVVGRTGAKGMVRDAPFEVLKRAIGLDGPGVRRYDGGGRAAMRQVMAPAAEPARERPRIQVPLATAAAPPSPPPRPAPDEVAGRRLSFSALSTLATCGLRFHLEYERGLRGRADAVIRTDGSGGGARGAWGGTAFGDLVHRALAFHEWRGPDPAPGWAAAAARAAGLPESEADAARAERLVADLLGSTLAERIRAGGALLPERPFATVVDGVLLSGAIDLLVDEGDGRALLLDWKTHTLGDGRSADDLAGEYALQQALYALAVLRAGWREVAIRWVALDDVSGGPQRVVGTGDAPDLEAAVRDALAPLRGAARPAAAATAQPFCSRCPGLDAMCPVSTAGSRPRAQAAAGGVSAIPRL